MLTELPPVEEAAVPYVVTLDAAGHLTALKLEMPVIGLRPAGEWTFQFTYGTAEPATEVK